MGAFLVIRSLGLSFGFVLFRVGRLSLVFHLKILPPSFPTRAPIILRNRSLIILFILL